MDERDVEMSLRTAGLRATSPRKAVLAMVAANPHADTDTISREVRAHAGPVSTQAVYDVLRVLTEHKLIRRIEPAGSVARYETRVGDNHHHVVCRICGVIGDVTCADGQAPCLTPRESHGFVIDEADVTYWGLCPTCAATR